MTYHWIAPNKPTLKINVHGTFSIVPRQSANDSGIGAIYRDSEGSMKLLTVGTIPFLTEPGNQLLAMYIPLLRAHYEGYRDVVFETDNFEAYKVVKTFKSGGDPVHVYDIASQIDIRVSDKNWKCKVVFVYPARNKVARFLARLRMEVCDKLYTFDRTVGGVEELLNWDLGLGIDHQDFQDVYLASESRDPVDFNMVASLSDQIKDLGLGQVGAPHITNLDVILNADVLHEGPGIKEDFFHGGVIFLEVAGEFGGDDMLEEVD